MCSSILIHPSFSCTCGAYYCAYCRKMVYDHVYTGCLKCKSSSILKEIPQNHLSSSSLSCSCSLCKKHLPCLKYSNHLENMHEICPYKQRHRVPSFSSDSTEFRPASSLGILDITPYLHRIHSKYLSLEEIITQETVDYDNNLRGHLMYRFIAPLFLIQSIIFLLAYLSAPYVASKMFINSWMVFLFIFICVIIFPSLWVLVVFLGSVKHFGGKYRSNDNGPENFLKIDKFWMVLFDKMKLSSSNPIVFSLRQVSSRIKIFILGILLAIDRKNYIIPEFYKLILDREKVCVTYRNRQKMGGFPKDSSLTYGQQKYDHFDEGSVGHHILTCVVVFIVFNFIFVAICFYGDMQGYGIFGNIYRSSLHMSAMFLHMFLVCMALRFSDFIKGEYGGNIQLIAQISPSLLRRVKGLFGLMIPAMFLFGFIFHTYDGFEASNIIHDFGVRNTISMNQLKSSSKCQIFNNNHPLDFVSLVTQNDSSFTDSYYEEFEYYETAVFDNVVKLPQPESENEFQSTIHVDEYGDENSVWRCPVSFWDKAVQYYTDQNIVGSNNRSKYSEINPLFADIHPVWKEVISSKIKLENIQTVYNELENNSNSKALIQVFSFNSKKYGWFVSGVVSFLMWFLLLVLIIGGILTIGEQVKLRLGRRIWGKPFGVIKLVQMIWNEHAGKIYQSIPPPFTPSTHADIVIMLAFSILLLFLQLPVLLVGLINLLGPVVLISLLIALAYKIK
ncbi:hypothetical protein ADUPG1_008225 [Aduncisulcus paluster]|uniref:Uncharacterized protein n=1 Tax=Aduncisulcus paluster TaxID=2918883 RepID=A0ABQ5KR77_9EUKA|nr:hypothetical protein ADUPG1_008225 [Aduncisulcus paluster]